MKAEDEDYSLEEQCIFCPQQQNVPSSDLFSMMNQALAAKHISQSNNHLILPIDVLLKIQDPNNATQLQDYILFKEYTYLDLVEQNMRRQYKKNEFQGKIKMLSEYYKFHKDIPHVVQRNIEKILAKYYDRKRQFDYKCIKRLLKQEQGLSITSVQQSVTQNSQTIQQKSRYSTLLNALQQNQSKVNLNQNANPLLSDSNVLEEICRQIGRALPKTKITDNDFKGSFYQNQLNFQNYVKKQQMKKVHKTLKASKVQEHLKRKTKGIVQQKLIDNYFNFQKKPNNYQSNQTIKNRPQNKFKSKKLVEKQKVEKAVDENKKKFIYNTNIKIQIQNALFYPNEHHPPQQFISGTSLAPKQFSVYPGETGMKSRKSLVGKISSINQDRYRTPVSKIYQPHQTQASTRYKRRNNSLKRQKQRLKTKQSKQFKDNHYQKQRQISVPRRVMSSHVFKRAFLQPHNFNNYQNTKQKPLKHTTISVARLKVQNKNDIKNEIRNRGNSVKRGGSSQNLRRRSITLTQNKHTIQKMAPLTKYSSSQIRDAKFKGISMKQLLTKKLNIYQR